MGGNALNITTRRYEREEYLDILLEIRTMLNNLAIVSEVPKWYSNKESFGDLDILIKSSTINGNIIDIINDIFKPNEIYSNSNVKSFDYKEFQIDFILTGDENWETSINYFSYNDLGNLIGRISYQMGFRFGHYGLKFVYHHEDGGIKFSKIISKDPEKIYEFLGFNYKEYQKGFDDINDIFKFVVNSRYFNRKIFDYQYLNHQNRTRNKKRKNYELFLEFIKEDNIHIIPLIDYQYRDKQFYIDKAESMFNVDLNIRIKKFNEIVDQQKKASGIFNGNVVMEHFNLRGKELGIAMQRFNTYFDSFIIGASDHEKKTYRSRWILDNNLNVILEKFKEINNL